MEVQPVVAVAPDAPAVAALQHDERNRGVEQPRRGSKPGGARADDHHKIFGALRSGIVRMRVAGSTGFGGLCHKRAGWAVEVLLRGVNLAARRLADGAPRVERRWKQIRGQGREGDDGTDRSIGDVELDVRCERERGRVLIARRSPPLRSRHRSRNSPWTPSPPPSSRATPRRSPPPSPASRPPPPAARARFGYSVCCTAENEVAHEIYALGKRAHGVAAMRAGGLFLNQLLYACCRESSMLDKALEVWADLQAAGEAVEAEPVGKLILACLAKSKYDDAFGAFLVAIDGGKQPAAPVCTALVRVCAVAPRLAASCYAVFLSMGGAGWRCRRRRRSASSALSDRHRQQGAAVYEA